MIPIHLSDKYVTITGMGGTSHHNLRIGDFKLVLAVHDPKDGTDHEVMCIFRNYACHSDPSERLKMQTIHPALQLEETGIEISDSLGNPMRMTLYQTVDIPIFSLWKAYRA
jgi:hypothetical protein